MQQVTTDDILEAVCSDHPDLQALADELASEVSMVLELLKSSSGIQKAQLIGLAGHLKSNKVDSRLAEYARDADPMIRQAVAMAAGRRSHKGRTDLINTLLDDEEVSVRRCALACLSESAAQGLKDRLAEMQESDECNFVKAMAESLRNTGTAVVTSEDGTRLHDGMTVHADGTYVLSSDEEDESMLPRNGNLTGDEIAMDEE